MASPKIVYVGIKYYNDKSVKFAQRLAKMINKYNGAVKVVPYFKTGRKLLSYFSAKTKQFVQDTSAGVYKLPCMDCNQVYIGETGKSMRIRIKQHESNCRNFCNSTRKVPVCGAVVTHHNLGHYIDFDNACLIYPESHRDKRKISEYFFINEQQHVMAENRSSTGVATPSIIFFPHNDILHNKLRTKSFRTIQLRTKSFRINSAVFETIMNKK
jgi:hypothetical protein